jgi:uncharacterized membrane protein
LPIFFFFFFFFFFSPNFCVPDAITISAGTLSHCADPYSDHLHSPFAHILYYPNAAYGVGYYLILSALHRFRYYGLMYPLTLLAALASVFLLGVLLHMRDICIVCVSVHIVNFTVLHITWNLATGHGKALNSGSKVD